MHGPNIGVGWRIVPGLHSRLGTEGVVFWNYNWFIVKWRLEPTLSSSSITELNARHTSDHLPDGFLLMCHLILELLLLSWIGPRCVQEPTFMFLHFNYFIIEH